MSVKSSEKDLTAVPFVFVSTHKWNVTTKVAHEKQQLLRQLQHQQHHFHKDHEDSLALSEKMVKGVNLDLKWDIDKFLKTFMK